MILKVTAVVVIGILLANCGSKSSRGAVEYTGPDSSNLSPPGLSGGKLKYVEAVKVGDMFTEISLLSDSTIENGVFNRVVFKFGDKTVFELYDRDSYDTIDNSVLIGFENEVKSKHILVHTVGAKCFISLWGAQYGCCPRKLTVLQADDQGFRILFKDEFEVLQIEKSREGNLKYFGIESYSESMNSVDSLDILLFTYAPTLVYVLNTGFNLDSASTIKYNEDNYVFAGFKYSADVKVAFPKSDEERRSGTRKPYIYK